MADVRGGGGGVMGCNDRCGCPTPCPGGAGCRCGAGKSDPTAKMEHMRCSCGDHCGCNPCTCSKTVARGTDCKCGAGCNCADCAA